MSTPEGLSFSEPKAPCRPGRWTRSDTEYFLNGCKMWRASSVSKSREVSPGHTGSSTRFEPGDPNLISILHSFPQLTCNAQRGAVPFLPGILQDPGPSPKPTFSGCFLSCSSAPSKCIVIRLSDICIWSREVAQRVSALFAQA